MLLAENPQDPPAEIKRLAVRALEAQALNPRALRLLGYLESNAGNVTQSRKLIGLASTLSRREGATQLWLINRAALDKDLPSALGHIDILLRTDPDSASVLYPILLRGLADPDFRKLLQSYMRRADDPWVADFVTYAIANAQDLTPIVNLVEEGDDMHRPGLTLAQSRLLMGRLDRAGHYAALERIYLLIPGAKLSRLRDPQFDASDVSEYYGVAGWQAFNGSDAGASFISKRKGASPSVVLYANPATTRTVAAKLMYLEPGTYSISTTLGTVNRGDGGSVGWQLRCPTREAGSTPWSGTLNDARSTLTMTIPKDCPIQFLDLVASGGQGQTGLDGTVVNLKLTPVGQTAQL